MDIKNEILWRIYLVLILVCIGAGAIFFQTLRIQVGQGEYWRAQADSLYLEYRDIRAERGNIFADDGSVLATSLPEFEVRMDLNTPQLTDELFDLYKDTLGVSLAGLPGSTMTQGAWVSYLEAGRAQGQRYLLIKKKVTYPELQKIRNFPLYNLGVTKSGLIVERKSFRKKPFGMLAHRTVGYVREGAKPVGLEGYYDEVLTGEKGKKLMQRVSGGQYIPVNDLTAVEPQSGKDVKTTINVNIQDITENALLRGLNRHKAKHGCAIVMEVETGAIKAIANIGKTDDGNYWETYNYAIGASVEPGSTIKAAAMMALLEDGLISVDDSINLNKGRMQFWDATMEDASPHNLEMTTIQRAFEISSNVGIAQLVVDNYQATDKEDRYIKRMKEFNLHQPTGIEVNGEGIPYIKEAGGESWSGITLPWMSIGYESKLTPLQLLTFYNAIANDGRMMKPYLVTEFQEYGQATKRFSPRVTKSRIASKKTIQTMQELLLGVVENGTAKKIKPNHYQIAGKTGTAILNYNPNLPKGYRKYQGFFVGFFPAQEPKYACIVVVNTPRENGIYGGQTAAPVFREIADKCVALHVDIAPPVNARRAEAGLAGLPKVKSGDRKDVEEVLAFLDLDAEKNTDAPWVSSRIIGDTLELNTRIIRSKVVPDVRGMGLRDAIFILGNLGMQVEVQGSGSVVLQSIRPGTQLPQRSIKLTLK